MRVCADRGLQLPEEFGAVPLLWAVHPEAAVPRIEEVGVADHIAAELLGEPLDERGRLVAEKTGQLRVALVIVLLEDILGHQLRTVVENAGLPLKEGTGRGDQACRARCVARRFVTLFEQEHTNAALRRRKRRDHPAGTRSNYDQGGAIQPSLPLSVALHSGASGRASGGSEWLLRSERTLEVGALWITDWLSGGED